MYTSIIDDDTRSIKINNANMVCRITSNFTFSFLLSCIIDLYNRIPLTANAIVQGMAIIFFRNIVKMKNKIPLPVPST